MRRGAASTALTAAVLVGAITGVTLTPTSAAWTDDEWVAPAQGLGVLDCADPAGLVASTGQGRLLSGGLLGIDLDSLAEVRGVTVESDGDTAAPTPTEAAPVAGLEDAWADPLQVGLLANALDLKLDGLSQILQLPLDTDLGVVGQFGQATGDGIAAGASGLLTDSGVIATEDEDHEYPDLAHLGLSQLLASLSPTLAATLAPVGDVGLDVGAVAGRAEIDGCEAVWSAYDTTAAAQAVTREYLVADVDTVVDSPLVDALVGDVTAVVDGLEATVNGLADDDGVTDALTGALSTLVGGLLKDLRLGNVTASITAKVDLTAVRKLLNDPFGDKAGVVLLDPARGTIRVDTAALLAQAYPGEYSAGLNGLPPNTEPLKDPVVVTTLTTVLGEVLDDWLSDVQARLDEARRLVQVKVLASVNVRVTVLPVARIDIVVDASLESLLAGTATVSTTTVVLGVLDLGLLDPVVDGLVAGLGLVIGGVVDTALGLTSVLTGPVIALVNQIVTGVTLVYQALYLDGVVSLTFNAQNALTAGNPAPADLAALEPGRYDVAALRIGVLDALGPAGVRLYLARGSVGPVCLAARCP